MGVVSPCGALLHELESIWSEMGESEEDKDRILLELERECLDVYRRKVEEANNARVSLHQAVRKKETELAILVSTLGELNVKSPLIQTDKTQKSLKKQLASITPLVEDMMQKKDKRLKHLEDIKAQIEKIRGEISGHISAAPVSYVKLDDQDLSQGKLEEYQNKLRTLQKDKSDRVRKIMDYVNEVHTLCGVLQLDFGKTISEVHPSLHEKVPEQCSNISDNTFESLDQTIQKLKLERKIRTRKLKEIVASLFELWNLMDSQEDERKHFGRITSIIGSSEAEVTESGVLSLEFIDQAAAEVERLTKLKAGRMKEIVMRRRSELEEICSKAHMEPDMSTDFEKSNAMMESGFLDPSTLLAKIEAEITKAKDESFSRREILERIERWGAACEEESWLEDYNQDESRYSSGRSSHINLKRAERARVTITKIPAMVDALLNKTVAWEKERKAFFLFDGKRLVDLLERYKLTRQQKEEEKKKYRDQKKQQDLLLIEKEAMYGSRPTPKRCNSFRNTNGYRPNENGSQTSTPRRLSKTPAHQRRLSAGGTTLELLTPRSRVGRQNGNCREMRRLSTAPLNFVPIQKDDSISYASTICDSEQGSPPHG